jgi:choline dehydrogenase-like flavoprotein
MSADFDVIVVGSGPAGVSSAFPLLEAGLKVLLVDGGREIALSPPSKPYLISRKEDENQWEWMIGKDYHALQNMDAVSPKLRVPIYAPVFDGFKDLNKIETKRFVAVGSLAQGGLSNAWGCGVARLSSEELRAFPFSPLEIEQSYSAVTRRMGVSGALQDDLSDYFGLDDWADPPIQIDALQNRLLRGYAKQKSKVLALGMRLGRSRVAVLGMDRGDRKACDLTGNCLWGCHRRSLYSATEDLKNLKRFPNFAYKSGFIVDRIVHENGYRAVYGRDTASGQTLTARKIVLAAGTLATTRITMQSIRLEKPVAMQACPTAAFMLWLPSAIGAQREPAFGLGQLSFALAVNEGISGFGSLFNTTGIPIAEFAKYLPFRKRYGIDFLKSFLSSCVVGNIFFPGHLSTATLSLTAVGGLRIEGGHSNEVSDLMRFSEQRLRKIFLKFGAILLPKSFTVGQPGSDIHYACSLPMRASPALGETNSLGEVFGLAHVHVVDGACLSSLSEKSHTLTVMANADRIARKLVMELCKVER